MEEILFTSSALLDFLSQIDEFSDKEISVTETINGGLQIQIGESTYEIQPNSATEIEVEEDVVEEVADINDSVYEDLSDDGYAEVVESGIITKALKTLLVGGLVKLTSKLLKD